MLMCRIGSRTSYHDAGNDQGQNGQPAIFTNIDAVTVVTVLQGFSGRVKGSETAVWLPREAWPTSDRNKCLLQSPFLRGANRHENG